MSCDTKLPNGVARGELVRCAETGGIYFRQKDVLRQLSPEAYDALGRPKYRNIANCSVIKSCQKGPDVNIRNYKSIKVTPPRNNCTVPRGRVVKCAQKPSIYLSLGRQLREFTGESWKATRLTSTQNYDCGMLDACSKGPPIQPAELPGLPWPGNKVRPPGPPAKATASAPKQPLVTKQPNSGTVTITIKPEGNLVPAPPAQPPAQQPPAQPQPPPPAGVKDYCTGHGTMNNTGEWCTGNCDKTIFDCSIGQGWYGRVDPWNKGYCVNCRMQNSTEIEFQNPNKYCTGRGTMNNTGEWCTGNCDKTIFDCPIEGSEGQTWYGRTDNDKCVNCRWQNPTPRKVDYCTGRGTMNDTGEWCTGNCDKNIFDCPVEGTGSQTWYGRTDNDKCVNCRWQNPTPRYGGSGGGGGGKIDSISGGGPNPADMGITASVEARIQELEYETDRRRNIDPPARPWFRFVHKRVNGPDGRVYWIRPGENEKEQLEWLVLINSNLRKIWESARKRHGDGHFYVSRLATLIADDKVSYVNSQWYPDYQNGVASFTSFTTYQNSIVPSHPIIYMTPWWQTNFPPGGTTMPPPEQRDKNKMYGKAWHLTAHEIGHALAGLWGHNEYWVHAWHWVLHESEAAGVWKHAQLFDDYRPDNGRSDCWDCWDPYDDSDRDRLMNVARGFASERNTQATLWSNPRYVRGHGCPCQNDLATCCGF